MSIYVCLYVHLYECLCMIYTSDNKSVYIRLFEYLYLCIHTFIRVIISICVLSQMNIITVCNKMHMTYDYYIKHNMPAIEWKINQLINKDKKLINKMPVSWIHPLNRKYKCHRI